MIGPNKDLPADVVLNGLAKEVFAVVCKSPLTQRLNDALSSSHFALAAKRAGFDMAPSVSRSPVHVPLLNRGRSTGCRHRPCAHRCSGGH